MTDLDNPLIVLSDHTVLLETENPKYEAARDALARFAELVKRPEGMHTYRITTLSLWNAAAAGMTAGQVVTILRNYSKYAVPENVAADIRDFVARYGRLVLARDETAGAAGGTLLLSSSDAALIAALRRSEKLAPFVIDARDEHTLVVDAAERGRIKQTLAKLGYPPKDRAGYVKGEALAVALRERTRSGAPFTLRPYQRAAVDAFYRDGSARGGSGVIVLPCGAGKTVVGLAALERLGTNTLIISPNTVGAHQWCAELRDKSTLAADQIGEYTGDRKELRPVTVTTYQMLTYRPEGSESYPHFDVFNARDWGLIIYDEVHLLPSPVFRITAELQSRRRLGLTATLVREDGREIEVFSLIGPKRYDASWKVLEMEGWIATAHCTEIRVPLPEPLRAEYESATKRQQFRLAAENPRKERLVECLVHQHRERGDRILIIGLYLAQLRALANRLGIPIITGQTSTPVREARYDEFRSGAIDCLIVSKIANYAIDLPDATVAIQVSGSYGSRQEEAQRLGRLLRPKAGTQAHFYTLVTSETRDEEFNANRQRFLTEQGYTYQIADADDYLQDLEEDQ